MWGGGKLASATLRPDTSRPTELTIAWSVSVKVEDARPPLMSSLLYTQESRAFICATTSSAPSPARNMPGVMWSNHVPVSGSDGSPSKSIWSFVTVRLSVGSILMAAAMRASASGNAVALPPGMGVVSRPASVRSCMKG